MNSQPIEGVLRIVQSGITRIFCIFECLWGSLEILNDCQNENHEITSNQSLPRVIICIVLRRELTLVDCHQKFF